MFIYQSITIVAILALTVNGFVANVKEPRFTNRVTTPSMMSMERLSLFTAELMSGPTARYNGELIDKSLKLVEKVPKPDGYVYGNVAPGAETFLAFGALLIVGVGALVPFILSIGESAQSQQRERESEDRIATYEFTQNKKGGRRSPLEFNKAAAKPPTASALTKSTTKGSFFNKK